MKISSLLSFLLLTLIACSCEKKEQSTDSPFHGMWDLDKFEVFDASSGTWSDDSILAGYNGYILYDGKGHMAVHLTPPGYENFDASTNIDSLDINELIKFTRYYQLNFVYFADYKTTDSIIDHHRLSATNPKDWGTVLTRDFEFRNDTLILTAHEPIGGRKLRLRWIKL